MADKTPQTEALTNWLLESDDNIESFKNDPKPHLDQHDVRLSDDEQANLAKCVASNDVASLKMTLTNTGAHTMFSTH